MRDVMDLYVSQALKNWAVNNPAPVSGRARLMLVAAASQREQTVVGIGAPQTTSFSLISPTDQAMHFYNLPWVLVAHVALTPIRRVT